MVRHNILNDLIDYSRQRDMDSDLGNITGFQHVIVGVGGIGYWTAIFLAMLGSKYFILIDGDTIEATNLNRLPVGPRHTGQMKVKVCKAQLRYLRPDVSVKCVPAHITDDTLGIISRLFNGRNNVMLWDCTDDARIQAKLDIWANRGGHGAHVSYVKIGYEGWLVGMYRKTRDTWLPDDYQPGYTTSRANVISSAVAAGLGIMYGALSIMLGGLRDDLNINLRDMFRRPIKKDPELEEMVETGGGSYE